ncbi:unnamed protein product [Strongylus vulgaris]|uniref:Uncharacterized protein n=1 Tax=Strongylus vulgaris TaxID=40348 RepID=A0A3P7IZZ0_STRVU|nr:unnamed protein product [Strongylus vulgaris]
MGWLYNEKGRRQMHTTNSEAKHPRGRPPTRWADVLVARIDQLNSQMVTSNGTEPELAAAVQYQHRG